MLERHSKALSCLFVLWEGALAVVLPCVLGLEPSRALRTVVMMTGSPLGSHGSLRKGWKLFRRWGSHSMAPRVPLGYQSTLVTHGLMTA